MLQLLQYDFNKYSSIDWYKFCLIRKIKRKVIDKQYKKSCFILQVYNNTEKAVFLTTTSII